MSKNCESLRQFQSQAADALLPKHDLDLFGFQVAGLALCLRALSGPLQHAHTPLNRRTGFDRLVPNTHPRVLGEVICDLMQKNMELLFGLSALTVCLVK